MMLILIWRIQKQGDAEHSERIIGKDRDTLIRDPLFLSLLSLIEAILSLIDPYISSVSILLRLYLRGSLSGGPYLSL